MCDLRLPTCECPKNLSAPSSLHFVATVVMATKALDLQDFSAASLQPILSHYEVGAVLTGLNVAHRAGQGRHVGV